MSMFRKTILDVHDTVTYYYEDEWPKTCEICKCPLSGASAAVDHISGKKHKLALKILQDGGAATQDNLPVDDTVMSRDQHWNAPYPAVGNWSNEDASYEARDSWAGDQEGYVPDEPIIEPSHEVEAAVPDVDCDICSLTFSTNEQLLAHCNGFWHKQKVGRMRVPRHIKDDYSEEQRKSMPRPPQGPTARPPLGPRPPHGPRPHQEPRPQLNMPRPMPSQGPRLRPPQGIAPMPHQGLIPRPYLGPRPRQERPLLPIPQFGRPTLLDDPMGHHSEIMQFPDSESIQHPNIGGEPAGLLPTPPDEWSREAAPSNYPVNDHYDQYEDRAVRGMRDEPAGLLPTPTPTPSVMRADDYRRPSLLPNPVEDPHYQTPGDNFTNQEQNWRDVDTMYDPFDHVTNSQYNQDPRSENRNFGQDNRARRPDDRSFSHNPRPDDRSFGPDNQAARPYDGSLGSDSRAPGSDKRGFDKDRSDNRGRDTHSSRPESQRLDQKSQSSRPDSRGDHDSRRQNLDDKGDSRGSRQDNRGGERDARGPRQNDRGGERDARGPRQNDRGGERDVRGPRHDDRSGERDVRAPRHDDRNGDRNNKDLRRDDRGLDKNNRDPKQDGRNVDLDDRTPRLGDRHARSGDRADTVRRPESIDRSNQDRSRRQDNKATDRDDRNGRMSLQNNRDKDRDDRRFGQENQGRDTKREDRDRKDHSSGRANQERKGSDRSHNQKSPASGGKAKQPSNEANVLSCEICQFSFKNSIVKYERHLTSLLHALTFMEMSLKMSGTAFREKYKSLGWPYSDTPPEGKMPPIVIESLACGVFEPLWILRSGLVHDFECKVCHMKADTANQWVQHVESQEHQKVCMDMMNISGINNFISEYWVIPGPHWRVMAKVGDSPIYKLLVPDYLKQKHGGLFKPAPLPLANPQKIVSTGTGEDRRDIVIDLTVQDDEDEQFMKRRSDSYHRNSQRGPRDRWSSVKEGWSGKKDTNSDMELSDDGEAGYVEVVQPHEYYKNQERGTYGSGNAGSRSVPNFQQFQDNIPTGMVSGVSTGHLMYDPSNNATRTSADVAAGQEELQMLMRKLSPQEQNILMKHLPHLKDETQPQVSQQTQFWNQNAAEQSIMSTQRVDAVYSQQQNVVDPTVSQLVFSSQQQAFIHGNAQISTQQPAAIMSAHGDGLLPIPGQFSTNAGDGLLPTPSSYGTISNMPTNIQVGMSSLKATDHDEQRYHNDTDRRSGDRQDRRSASGRSEHGRHGKSDDAYHRSRSPRDRNQRNTGDARGGMSDRHTSDRHTSDRHTSDRHTSDRHTSDRHTTADKGGSSDQVVMQSLNEALASLPPEVHEQVLAIRDVTGILDVGTLIDLVRVIQMIDDSVLDSVHYMDEATMMQMATKYGLTLNQLIAFFGIVKKCQKIGQGSGGAQDLSRQQVLPGQNMMRGPDMASQPGQADRALQPGQDMMRGTDRTSQPGQDMMRRTDRTSQPSQDMRGPDRSSRPGQDMMWEQERSSHSGQDMMRGSDRSSRPGQDMMRGSDMGSRPGQDMMRGSDRSSRPGQDMMHGSDRSSRPGQDMMRGSDRSSRPGQDMMRGSDMASRPGQDMMRGRDRAARPSQDMMRGPGRESRQGQDMRRHEGTRDRPRSTRWN